MLSGFRIGYSEVTVIPLQMLLWAPDPATKEEFTNMIQGAGISQEELDKERGKTNRLCDFSVSPSPNWTFCFWTSLGLGLGLGGLGLGLGLDNMNTE